MSGNAIVVVSGVCIEKPDFSFTSAGIAITKTSIAEEILVYNPYSKQREKTTRWWNITCFGKPAENLGTYAWKGTVAQFSGTFDCRMYTGKDDIVKQSYDMNASTCNLISKFGKTDPNETNVSSNLSSYNPQDDINSDQYKPF